MNGKSFSILEKINEIEKALQKLKIELMFPLKKENKFKIYSTKKILKEIRKIRKNLWNEKYSKAI